MRNLKLLLILFFGLFLAISCRSVKKDKSSLTEIVKSETSEKQASLSKEETKDSEQKEVVITDNNKTIIEEVITEREGVKETRRKTTINTDKVIHEISDSKTTISKEIKQEKQATATAEKINKQSDLHLERSIPILWSIIGATVVFFGLGLLYQHNKTSITTFLKKIWWV